MVFKLSIHHLTQMKLHLDRRQYMEPIFVFTKFPSLICPKRARESTFSCLICGVCNLPKNISPHTHFCFKQDTSSTKEKMVSSWFNPDIHRHSTVLFAITVTIT